MNKNYCNASNKNLQFSVEAFPLLVEHSEETGKDEKISKKSLGRLHHLNLSLVSEIFLQFSIHTVRILLNFS